VLFAVDSVPAIFGITRDPFLVFTSNVFAILGLRALYFLLAGVLDRFRYLHYGLAAVLAFVGLKMIVEGWRPEIMPAWASLAVIAVLLGVAIVASMRAGKGRK
jgi:tellurite resistance protein TerC